MSEINDLVSQSEVIIHQKGDMSQDERDACPEGSLEDIPRHVPLNPYKYTPSELAKRSNAIATMTTRYPHCPYSWIGNLYDVLEHKSLEEIKDIIDNRTWEGPPKPRQCGGIIKDAFCVLEPDQNPHLSLDKLKIETQKIENNE